MILRGLLFFVLFLINNIGFGQYSGPSAFAFLDSTVMVIGDKVLLHIGVDFADKDNIVSITPDIPLDSSKFEVINGGKWEAGGRTRDWGRHRDIAFTVWDTGLYQIPSVEFIIRHANGSTSALKSPPLLLTVNNPKGVDQMAGPADIKEIIYEDRNFEDIMPWLIGVVLLGSIGIGAWFFYKKWKEKSSIPIIQIVKQPPHIVAERLLKELKTKQLWQKGDIKEYYYELSHILRGYIEEAFDIPALESTTDELMQRIQSRKGSGRILSDDPILLQKVQDLLETADLAKFAKVIPPEEFHDKLWADALNIVDKTKPKPVEDIDNQLVKPS
jgi:hypothetical protein